MTTLEVTHTHIHIHTYYTLNLSQYHLKYVVYSSVRVTSFMLCSLSCVKEKKIFFIVSFKLFKKKKKVQ